MAEGESGVEELYKNFGVLADAGDKAGEKLKEYEGILQSAKGTPNKKKLAAGFITRFYHMFPTLAETAMDTLLDLVEEENDVIRRTAIKALPDICKHSPEAALVTKVAEYLTQLLATEDVVDLALVKTGLATLLQKNAAAAMEGIFSQVGGEDEGVREKAIEYVSTSLMSMRHILFIPHPENEKLLVAHVKKALADVTGEEFEVFMEMLSKLQFLSTVEGAQEVMDVIVQQAELSSQFKAGEGESVDRFVTCCKQALKFCKRGCDVTPFVAYLCQSVLPVFSVIKEEEGKQELLHLLAECCLYPLSEDCVKQCLPNVFTLLLEYVPLPPEEEGEPPSFQYSTVECALFGFHQLVQKVPGFITDTENAERLKDFKKRLQYFARKCQAYHSSLQAAVKSKGSVEVNDEQAKLRSVALKITANINVLIRDFFHNPPSYQAKVKLSWGAEKTVVQRKRPSAAAAGSEATPTKRKHSPIRFGSSDEEGKVGGVKRESLSLYQPPRDRFSKNVSNGRFTESGGRRGRGRGRGRGWRGGF